MADWTEDMNMMVAEWDMETALEVREEEGFERGIEIGEKRGVKIGFDQGRSEGRNEGRSEGLIDTARNALAKGYTPEQVRDITGLDMETLARLRNH